MEITYISKGLAHGFKANIEDTIAVYNVSMANNKESDFYIRYGSLGFSWEAKEPILSNRDMSFVSLDIFTRQNTF